MMKRVRSDNPYAIWWQKKGRGTMHLQDGRKIEGGDKFQATEAEVNGLENWLIPLETKLSEKKTEVIGIKPQFFLRQRGAWWDVVDNEGKVINENALRKTQAEGLKQELEN
jgi:hypothetical protein